MCIHEVDDMITGVAILGPCIQRIHAWKERVGRGSQCAQVEQQLQLIQYTRNTQACVRTRQLLPDWDPAMIRGVLINKLS